MNSILDFTAPVDVAAIEQVVGMMMSPEPQQVMEAQAVLTEFMNHGDAYTRVDTVLSTTNDPHTQFFALQVLDRAILAQWHLLPAEQQQGIRDFLVGFIMAKCTSVAELRNNYAVVNRANTTLVSVAKREWPAKWPTFVQEVVHSAQHGEAMAENAIAILECLVEEVFEFGEKTMTQRWIQRKRAALADDFALVWNLCGELLLSPDPALQRRVLQCVEKYVPYVDHAMVFNEGFLNGVANFMGSMDTAAKALRVLTEVAGLTTSPANNAIVEGLFMDVMGRVIQWLPDAPGLDLAARVHTFLTVGKIQVVEFLDALSLFITRFLPKHIGALQFNSREALVATHEMIVGFLRVDEKEIFKTCVEYCWWLGDYLVHPRQASQGSVALLRATLQQQLSEIRYELFRHMARPEEVIIVENDEGELVNETVSDAETLSLYVSMRETLVFLTHLDHRDTLNIIDGLMRKQVDGSDFSWHNINTLCWSFGAISGALTVDVEKNTFVSFLRDLLTLVERMRGRENRAVIASGIMYVVGQYPRFLNNHARFLKTVVSKNCDFMKEEFPGVKDMAVDTLMKVLRQCAATLWSDAASNFARELVRNLEFYAAELNQPQTCALYEAVGHLLAVAPRSEVERAVLALLAAPNATWQEMMSAAKEQTFDVVMASPDDVKSLIHALRCINRTAISAGGAFIVEMHLIFWDLQELYSYVSQRIGAAIADGTVKQHHARLFRTVKREILRTIEHFILNAEDLEFVSNECVPHLFRAILADYQSCAPTSRDPQVLAVVTAAVKRLKGHLSEGVPHILDATFASTAELITANSEEYPEHRVNLFALIRAINMSCFEAFLEYVKANPAVIQGVLWAAKHIEMNTCNAGLDALNDFVTRVLLHEEAAAGFFAEFGATIVVDTLVAMLDTLHRPAFRKQWYLLSRIFYLAGANQDEGAAFGRAAIHQAVVDTLTQIPTVSPNQANEFATAAFDTCQQPMEFQRLFSDLMVEVQVWGAEQENADIKAEEQAIREDAIEGLARPHAGSYNELRQLQAELADMLSP